MMLTIAATSQSSWYFDSKLTSALNCAVWRAFGFVAFLSMNEEEYCEKNGHCRIVELTQRINGMRGKCDGARFTQAEDCESHG